MWNICTRVRLIHYPQHCKIISQLRLSNSTYVYFRKKSIRSSKLITQNPGTATVHNGWYWNTPKWNLISEAFSSKEKPILFRTLKKNITFCNTLISFIVKPLRNKLSIWHISWVKEFRVLTHTFQGPTLGSKPYHVTLIAKLERSSANFVEHMKKKENPFVYSFCMKSFWEYM